MGSPEILDRGIGHQKSPGLPSGGKQVKVTRIVSIKLTSTPSTHTPPVCSTQNPQLYSVLLLDYFPSEFIGADGQSSGGPAENCRTRADVTVHLGWDRLAWWSSYSYD